MYLLTKITAKHVSTFLGPHQLLDWLEKTRVLTLIRDELIQ